MTSEIRTNSITSRAGLSTVTLSDTGPIVTGIATFGVNTKIDGGNSVINVGTALTIGHTQGVQFNTQNLHSNGFEVNNINASGIITATSFKGDGSNLTGISAGVSLANGVDNRVVTATGAAALNGEANLVFTGSKLGVNEASPYAEVDIASSVEDANNGSLGNHGIRLSHIGASDEEVIPITAGFKSQQGRVRAGIGFIAKTISGSDGSGGAIGFYTRNTADGNALYRTDERVRIAENGNFGIGLNSPAVKLHASKSYSAPTGGFDSNIVAAFTNSGTNSYAGLAIQGGSGAGSFIHFGDTDDSNIGIINYEHSDNSFRFTVNTDQRLKITHADATLYGTTDGVLNITTTDARGSFIRFQESGTSKVWVGCGQGLGLGAANDLGLRATNDIRFRSGAEEHAVLTAEGFFAAKGLAGNWASSNTHPASSQFHQFIQTGSGKRIVVFRNEHHAGLGVNIEMSSTGNGESLYCTGNGSVRFRVLNNGSVGSANNSYGGISDIKLKENIVDAKSQWNDIKAIRVRNFNFKDTPDTKMLGVVAQEIETISPNLISELVDRDPETNETLETTTKEVKYSILYMKAIKCLQEAQARIEKLEEDNIALRTRVTNLEGN